MESSALDYSRLQRWLDSPPPPPPLLLTAADANTLTSAVARITAAAVCEKKTASPCGTCRSCRLVQQGSHPDVIVAQRQGKTWTIKDIRRLLEVLSRTSFGARRLVSVAEVERLTPPAANAFLKALEEPGLATHYVLTTQWPGRLLATIRSRCQLVRLSSSPVITPTATAWWPAALPERLSKNPNPLTEDELATIAGVLDRTLKQQGPTPTLRRAYQRLRDYHLIVAKQGNEKLAREVLLLSLPAGDGM